MPSYEHHLDRHNPRHQIPHYRAIVFDGEGQVLKAFDIDADDDETALAVAREQAGIYGFELLDGMQVLGRHGPQSLS